MKQISRKRLFIGIPAILLALILLLLAGSYVANQFRPVASTVVERLSDADKARLAELFHLRQEVGNEVWPGFGDAEIPVILYNEAYAFLVGYGGQPPDGWLKVPNGPERGGPWEVVPGDAFQGEPYYRQRLPAGITPEAFTVRVGDQWVASLSTLEWTRITLADGFAEMLPGPIAAVFPQYFAATLFMSGSDHHIAAILHEGFHAFQGTVAPERLAAAEEALAVEGDYPWEDETVNAAWEEEFSLLRRAVEAGSEDEAAALASQFLEARAARRAAHDLAPAQVALERQREWLEGSAKYVEMEVWRQGAAPGYDPLRTDVPEFDAYRGFDDRWAQELGQMGRGANTRSESRFYYSGWGQAALLDRLAPGWKEGAMAPGVFLEELLEAAVAG